MVYYQLDGILLQELVLRLAQLINAVFLSQLNSFCPPRAHGPAEEKKSTD